MAVIRSVLIADSFKMPLSMHWIEEPTALTSKILPGEPAPTAEATFVTAPATFLNRKYPGEVRQFRNCQ